MEVSTSDLEYEVCFRERLKFPINDEEGLNLLQQGQQLVV